MDSPPRSAQTVPVLNDTVMPAFTMPWQLAPPQDALVVVVKGTFRLVPGAAAALAEEQQLPTGEEPFEGAEAVMYPGDDALFKPRADFLVGGSVYGGTQGSARAEARFGADVSIAFAALGNRTWVSGRPSAPEAFGSVPLRPELAFGGPGHQLNPHGRGMVSEDGHPLPNLERLDAPVSQPSDRPAPVLLGPLERTHPLRTARLGTYDGAWQRSRWPYFPDDFDWSYFNAAPPELQIPHPSGTERFFFAGMHPELAVIEGTLPELKPRAFVQRLARPDELEPVRLRIDTLHFVPDRLELVMVWRGVVDVGDEEASDLGAVFVCAEEGPGRFDTPELRRRFERRVRERVERVPEIEGVAEDEERSEPEPPAPPPGVVPARGLTPSMAAALGLPPWTATLPDPEPSPPSEEQPEPPPAPVMSRAAIEGELSAGASFAERDLSDCDLTGLCFDGCDLSDAQLLRARLDGATFRGANLARAVLIDAHGPGVVMRGTDLSEADLSGAVLDGVELDEAQLVEASLAGARLEGASLVGTQAAGSVWTDAVLRGARFQRAVLTGADFSGANLEAVVLEDVALEDGRLYEVEAAGLTVRRARAARLRVDAARLSRTLWEELEAPDSSWRDADLAGVRMSAADLARAVFVNADLTDAELDRIDGTEALFRLAKLVRARLRKANLMKACFESADLRDADARLANLYGSETWKAQLGGVRLDGAIVAMSKLDRG